MKLAAGAYVSEGEKKQQVVEFRVLNDADFSTIHDRYIIDDSHAYNIPPLNIIHKKLGDIKPVTDHERARAKKKPSVAPSTNGKIGTGQMF